MFLILKIQKHEYMKPWKLENADACDHLAATEPTQARKNMAYNVKVISQRTEFPVLNIDGWKSRHANFKQYVFCCMLPPMSECSQLRSVLANLLICIA